MIVQKYSSFEILPLRGLLRESKGVLKFFDIYRGNDILKWLEGCNCYLTRVFNSEGGGVFTNYYEGERTSRGLVEVQLVS